MTWKPLGSPWASTSAPWAAPSVVKRPRGRPPKVKPEPENSNIALAEEEPRDHAPVLRTVRALRESLTEQIAAARDPEAQLEAALEMIDMQRRVIESLVGEEL